MKPTVSTRRRVLQGIGAAGTVGVLGGSSVAVAQQEDDNGVEADVDEEFAAVRLGHFSPGAPEVDVYFGKTPDLNPTVGGLAYPAVGPVPNDGYLQLPPGTYNVAITPAGETDTLTEVDELDFEAGLRYTILAIGQYDEVPDEIDEEDEEEVDEEDEEEVDEEDEEEVDEEDEDDEDEVDEETEFQPIIIVDAGSEAEATPEADDAEVSFVHTSPDAGPVDITVDGDTLVEDVSFGEASDIFVVDPGEYDIDVLSEGEEVLSVTRELREGTRITAYVAGLADPDPPEEEEVEEEEEDVEEEEEEEDVEEEEEEEDVEEEEEEDVEEEDEEEDVEEEDEENDVEDENNPEHLPGLSVVTSLDGTNPFADEIVMR